MLELEEIVVIFAQTSLYFKYIKNGNLSWHLLAQQVDVL